MPMRSLSRCEEAWRKLLEQAVTVVGSERVIKDDVSRLGLHRKHVVRCGELPDVEAWKNTVPDGATKVSYWVYKDDDGIGHLWLCWKE
jgi:hypothetical protein